MINTSKIIIRPITREDTENIVKWRNSPSVVQNFIFRKPLTKEDHLKWYETKIKAGNVAQFIIIETDTDKPVGSVYLRDIDKENKKAEFGIFIGEDCARGKGYGTAATALIVKYGFEELDLNRIYLRVFADNLGAIKCYKKCGFKQEGVFREDVIIDGKPYDMVFMGLLKSEWQSE
ncbi:MAG: GNAT family N-acetyltransferase, partial [Acutalibacteraceae bacterium]